MSGATETIMTEEDQYNAICKGEFRAINNKLERIHNRLFVDNGSPSVQTRLDRNERMWKLACWILGMVVAASVAQVAQDVARLLSDHDRTHVEETASL